MPISQINQIPVFQFDPNQQYRTPKKARGPLKVFLLLFSWLIIGLAVLALVAILALVPHLDDLRGLYRYSMSGKTNLEAAEQYIYDQKFTAAYEALSQSRQDFAKAEGYVKTLEQKKLFQLPVIRDQFVIADDFLAIGYNLSTSLERVSYFAQNILVIIQQPNLNFSSLTEKQKQEMLTSLAALAPQLEASRDEIANIQLAWQDVGSRRDIFLWQPMIKSFEQKLPKVLKGFDYLILASKNLPPLVGLDQEKTYLFLLQNNNELRPGGGFIGTYGILKMKNAEIVSFHTDNVYNLDLPAANRVLIPSPRPFKDYMNIPWWYMRDANWWPDFPTSAQKVEEFYYLEKPGSKQFDGVIAINPDFVEDLLALVGPITVDGITFNKDNFFKELEYQVEFGYYKQGIPENQRKEIIGDLYRELEKKLFELPLNRWTELLEVANKNLDEKYVVGYFNDMDLQQEMQSQNWAGQVQFTAEDYLMIVDANMGALKTDAAIKRTIDYSLTQEVNRFIVETAVNYRHTGVKDELTSRYRSYSRLYVPTGSELLSVKIGDQELDLNKVDKTNEFGKDIFGVFFEVEPQTDKTIAFKYVLPKRLVAGIEDGDYKLLIQKQPGMRDFDVNLNLFFDKKVKVFGKTEANNSAKFSATLKTDELFTVLFE
jgi:hypothetical protein